jgi:hypothetical protein
MLELINDYLRLGLDANNDASSVWPLALAAVLMAAMILDRQSRD